MASYAEQARDRQRDCASNAEHRNPDPINRPMPESERARATDAISLAWAHALTDDALTTHLLTVAAETSSATPASRSTFTRGQRAALLSVAALRLQAKAAQQ